MHNINSRIVTLVKPIVAGGREKSLTAHAKVREGLRKHIKLRQKLIGGELCLQ